MKWSTYPLTESLDSKSTLNSLPAGSKISGVASMWKSSRQRLLYRTMFMNHLDHHRAQLGVYLRLVKIAVPGRYGPSADELLM
jgi:uncharacterized damage-inducible protein DinB